MVPIEEKLTWITLSMCERLPGLSWRWDKGSPLCCTGVTMGNAVEREPGAWCSFFLHLRDEAEEESGHTEIRGHWAHSGEAKLCGTDMATVLHACFPSWFPGVHVKEKKSHWGACVSRVSEKLSFTDIVEPFICDAGGVWLATVCLKLCFCSW